MSSGLSRSRFVGSSKTLLVIIRRDDARSVRRHRFHRHECRIILATAICAYSHDSNDTKSSSLMSLAANKVDPRSRRCGQLRSEGTFIRRNRSRRVCDQRTQYQFARCKLVYGLHNFQAARRFREKRFIS